MKIGIDARLYSQTGVGRYIRNLIWEFASFNSENQYFVYLRKSDIANFRIPNNHWNIRCLDVPWHTIREQLEVPLQLLKDKLDIIHFPYFNIPILYPGKYVVTVHDLIVDHFDTGRASTLNPVIYKLKRIGYHITHKIGIKRASAIAVISQTTKQELIDHYQIDVNKITVTYDAIDRNFASVIKGKIKRKKRLSFPYILYVGNAYPHKNIERLLQVFVILRKKHAIKLVLTGDDGYFYPRIKKTTKLLGIDGHVIFFGNANDKELAELYTFAKCLVFPSLMEGFGLPNLEAIACGCLPVVANLPVFNEIWSDLLPSFDPYNIENMAAVISNVITMPIQHYRKKVFAAAKLIDDYSWSKTAKQTLNIYESIR